MALSWAATLLRECDLERQGIDLFGRDSFLLGRLLITLGVLCMACAAQHFMRVTVLVLRLFPGTAGGEGAWHKK